jgi:hypothetical protein
MEVILIAVGQAKAEHYRTTHEKGAIGEEAGQNGLWIRIVARLKTKSRGLFSAFL